MNIEKDFITENPFAVLIRRMNRLESQNDQILSFLQNKKDTTSASATLPIISSAQVKAMTGWPDGTFYQKVAQMPEGVVIRGKSKRLLFDRAKLIAWLTDADDTDNLPFGPTPRKKGGVVI